VYRILIVLHEGLLELEKGGQGSDDGGTYLKQKGLFLVIACDPLEAIPKSSQLSFCFNMSMTGTRPKGLLADGEQVDGELPTRKSGQERIREAQARHYLNDTAEEALYYANNEVLDLYPRGVLGTLG